MALEVINKNSDAKLYLTRALPPKLLEDVYDSSVTIAVDEPKLCRGMKVAGFVIKWWGEDEPTYVMRLPCNNLVYRIATSVIQSYLSACEVVEFTFVLPDLENVGSCFIYEPVKLLSQKPVTAAIVDHGGQCIGDVKVQFSLNDTTNSNDLSAKSDDKILGHKTNESKFGVQCKSISEREKRVESKGMDLYRTERINSSFKKCLENKSQIMGYESILEREKNLKGLNSYRTDCANTFSKNCPKNEKISPMSSAIMDYLLGKELTYNDEQRALTYLERFSPCNSFVSAVTKSCNIEFENNKKS